jgi:hypothetical protein
MSLPRLGTLVLVLVRVLGFDAVRTGPILGQTCSPNVITFAAAVSKRSPLGLGILSTGHQPPRLPGRLVLVEYAAYRCGWHRAHLRRNEIDTSDAACNMQISAARNGQERRAA